MVSTGASLVLGSAFLAFLMSQVFKKNMDLLSSLYRVDFTPEGFVFGVVWWTIFASAWITSALLLFEIDGFGTMPESSLFLWAVAFFCCAIWATFLGLLEGEFKFYNKFVLGASSLLLVTATICVAIGVGLSGKWKSFEHLNWAVFAQSSMAILGGWLLCASTLNIAHVQLAVTSGRPIDKLSDAQLRQLVTDGQRPKSKDDPPDRGSQWLVLALAVAAAGVAVALPDPLYVVGPELLVLGQRGPLTRFTIAGMVVLLLGAGGAVVRSALGM